MTSAPDKVYFGPMIGGPHHGERFEGMTRTLHVRRVLLSELDPANEAARQHPPPKVTGVYKFDRVAGIWWWMGWEKA